MAWSRQAGCARRRRERVRRQATVRMKKFYQNQCGASGEVNVRK
jgi:hypothetical protein